MKETRPLFLRSSLLSFPSLIHGFGTKRMAVELFSSLFPGHPLFLPEQVHESGVFILKSLPSGTVKADAVITSLPGILIGVRSADCVPILFADPYSGICGAIHAGWRGLLAGVVERTLLEANSLFSWSPDRAFFAIGPSIGQCCYTVSSEFLNTFTKKYGEEVASSETGSPRLHLRKAARLSLLSSGAADERIEFVGPCTRCDRDFFSWRRGDRKGRQVSFIGLAG